MGPSTFVDGDSWGSCRPPRPEASFNGAIDFRRRRPGSVGTHRDDERQLQWGHRLSSTETGWRREGSHLLSLASMEPSTFVDGDVICYSDPNARLLMLQWGHRLSSTETHRLGRRRPAPLRASMGPSTFVDGDLPRVPRAQSNFDGFNGAIDFRRRRRTAPTCPTSPSPRFNGAIDFRRRRRARGGQDHQG